MTVTRRIRRALISLHRYLGLGLCLVFCVWFLSGFVMLFARYPRMSEDARLARLPALATDAVGVGAAALPHDAEAISLTTVEGRPAFRVVTGAGIETVFADNGQAMTPVGVERARAVVRNYFAPKTVNLAYLGSLETPDQWTLGGGHEAQWPLHRFAVGDDAATEVYVSARAGTVVQETVRRQRVLAWLGAIPHWAYFAALRRHRGAWRQAVIAVASVGSLTCLAGLAGGLMLFRWRGRRRGSPYRHPWLRRHHWLGLVFGTLAFTWVLSGALSLNPLRWSPGSSPSAAQRAAAAGGDLRPQDFALPLAPAIAACAERGVVRELELMRILGRPFYLCIDGRFSSWLLAADGSAAAPVPRLPAAELTAIARAALPRAPLMGAELRGPDAYLYSSPTGPALRFPVFRADFADGDRTSLYIDPHSGQLLARHNRTTRVERWLYHGLHSWDFPGLYRRRGLWFVVIITFLAGSFTLSLTGVIVGVRWSRAVLRRRPAANQRKQEKSHASSLPSSF